MLKLCLSWTHCPINILHIQHTALSHIADYICDDLQLEHAEHLCSMTHSHEQYCMLVVWLSQLVCCRCRTNKQFCMAPAEIESMYTFYGGC